MSLWYHLSETHLKSKTFYEGNTLKSQSQSDLFASSTLLVGLVWILKAHILRGDLMGALSIDQTFSATTNRLVFQLMCLSLSLMLQGCFLTLVDSV